MAQGTRHWWIVLAAAGLIVWTAALAAPPPPAGAGKPAAGKAPAGLHITDGARINNWNYVMTDGGSYSWDLQQSGGVGSGSNNAYGSGMYLYVNNNNFHSSGGVVNKALDELEVGPWSPDSRIRVSRRIKVYRDRPLARWLDIYENLTGAEIQLQVWSYINCNWNIARLLTDTGGTSFGDKDFAFATMVQPGMVPNPPSTCHIVCSKNSKLRPNVQANNNQVNVRWTLTLPPNSTVILCQFESQNNSFEDQQKLMSSFQAGKLLRDLSGAMRRLIVNFNVSGGFEDVELERSDKFDGAILTNADPLHGKILNASYEVEGFLGKMTLAADQVIGMASMPGEAELVRFVLTDGQIVCGSAANQKLQMQLVSGPTLQIPLERLSQFSYAISADKPSDIAPTGGMAMLRTGDRLAIDPKALNLNLQSLYGPVSLDPAAMQRIVLDNPSNGIHRALFLNGSSLAGFLEPETISIPAKLVPRLQVSRNMISEIVYTPQAADSAPMARVVMSNGDELLGQLAGGKLSVKTDYGPTDVEPQTLRSLTFSEGNHSRAILELWDGSRLHGDLSAQELSFQLMPGPVVKLPIAQVDEFSAPYAVPPEGTIREVALLIEQLQSDSWKQRQDATEKLVKIGACVIPLLQPRLDDSDAEVRQRAATIIERINAAEKPAPAKKPAVR